MINVAKRLKFQVALTVFICIVLSVFQFAFALDEEIEEKYPGSDQEAIHADRDALFPGWWFQNFKPEISIDIQQGYDNNVNLNPSRDKDAFQQGLFSLELGYDETGNTLLKAGVDVFETIYYKYNDNNLLDVAPYLGFDWEFARDFVWKNQIAFDYFSYPNKSSNTFIGLELKTALRHYLSDILYHELEYNYIQRWYTKRKIVLVNAGTGTEEREDTRNKIKYTWGVFLFDSAFLKLSNEFYYNDSNDEFQEYYDYWAYKVKPSVMYFFTDKLYAYGSCSWKYRDYKDRRNTEDAEETVTENTWIFSSSLYYDVTENLTFELTCSYSENYPSDPFYKYSGTIVTGGFFYSF
jgi:hypothetical protein